jgi:hypothetical protein
VGRAQLDRVDAELHTLLSGQPEAVRQAGIIRAEAQQTCHQCAVGAVASACRGKAAIQTDVGIHRDIAQQLLCRVSNFGCTRRVAGRGPDHDRPQNVKQAHTMHILSYSLQKSPSFRPVPAGKSVLFALFLCFIIPLLPHLCYNNFTNV